MPGCLCVVSSPAVKSSSAQSNPPALPPRETQCTSPWGSSSINAKGHGLSFSFSFLSFHRQFKAWLLKRSLQTLHWPVHPHCIVPCASLQAVYKPETCRWRALREILQTFSSTQRPWDPTCMIETGPGQLPLRAGRSVLGVNPIRCPPQAPQQSLKRLRRYAKRTRKMDGWLNDWK